MANCRNCGAYIPDGDQFCVACGAPVQAPQASQAAQSAQAFQQEKKDDLYETLKETQAKQKAQAQAWASQAGSAGHAHSTSQNVGGTPTAQKPAGAMQKSGISKSAVLAFLSYCGALCVLPFFLAKDDDFALFHGRQGVVLFITSILANIAAKILPLGLLRLAIRAAIGIFTIIGFYNVFDKSKRELPFIGKYAAKLKF